LQGLQAFVFAFSTLSDRFGYSKAWPQSALLISIVGAVCGVPNVELKLRSISEWYKKIIVINKAREDMDFLKEKEGITKWMLSRQ
jgi:hypothetical protein